jgi:hypothetical protein
VRQCGRLLRFLHYCQQQYTHFTDLYFQALEQCIKSDNEKIVTIVLQQIASHLFEVTHNDEERKRLIHHLPSETSGATISQSHQSILATIHALTSTNRTEQETAILLSNHIDILYPYTARFLDVRREFRDSTHYFIDGDSLLLSIAHHINVDLISYYGNTLHVIYIIERILLTLFNQSHQCNYTLVFFDCHYQLYQAENSILGLIRTCLIVHLSKNAEKCGTSKVRQFSSWLDDDYLEFSREEKPMFIFYHDMSSFDAENDKLLSKNVLEKLICVYRLFGNYHQYIIQCQVYIMNKLTLSETSVKCFQIQFHRMCPTKLLTEIVRKGSLDLQMNGTKERDWNEFDKLCQEIGGNDVRLFLYLKTIVDFMEENKEQNLIQLLCPLLVLHVALLIRLSLTDRHLSLSFPLVTFSPAFSQLIVQFQQRLSRDVSSHHSSLSWSKVGDLFDGRLFAFTLHQFSSSNIRLDSTTFEIIKQSLSILKVPSTDTLFEDIIKQLIQSNDISFSSSSLDEQVTKSKRQKIIRISNPFVDTYLKPILTSNKTETFDLVEPDGSQVAQYKGTLSLLFR